MVTGGQDYLAESPGFDAMNQSVKERAYEGALAYPVTYARV